MFERLAITDSNFDLIDHIFINTDSEEIANDAVKNFNVTIHMRPKFLLNIKSNEASQVLSYDISKLKGEY